MRHRPNKLICGIDGTSFSLVMAVVAFVFLASAMTVTPTVTQCVSVYLPKVAHPVAMLEASRHDALIVLIVRDGHVFFRQDPVNPENLPAKIREALGQTRQRKVYIRADRTVKYGVVKEVLDAVRDAGVENVGFIVSN